MDKYEYELKVEQIEKLIKRKDYATAKKIADAMEWKKEKDTSLLRSIAEVYVHSGEAERALYFLRQAYNASPRGIMILERMIGVALDNDILDVAEEFCDAYEKIAPDSSEYAMFRYRIAVEKKSNAAELIKWLRLYCDREMDEEYRYRLAELYEEINDRHSCIMECDYIINFFCFGEYVEKAAELKEKYAELDEYQVKRLAEAEIYEKEYKDYVKVENDREIRQAREEEAQKQILEAQLMEVEENKLSEQINEIVKEQEREKEEINLSGLVLEEMLIAEKTVTREKEETKEANEVKETEETSGDKFWGGIKSRLKRKNDKPEEAKKFDRLKDELTIQLEEAEKKLAIEAEAIENETGANAEEPEKKVIEAEKETEAFEAEAGDEPETAMEPEASIESETSIESEAAVESDAEKKSAITPAEIENKSEEVKADTEKEESNADRAIFGFLKKLGSVEEIEPDFDDEEALEIDTDNSLAEDEEKEDLQEEKETFEEETSDEEESEEFEKEQEDEPEEYITRKTPKKKKKTEIAETDEDYGIVAPEGNFMVACPDIQAGSKYAVEMVRRMDRNLRFETIARISARAVNKTKFEKLIASFDQDAMMITGAGELTSGSAEGLLKWMLKDEDNCVILVDSLQHLADLERRSPKLMKMFKAQYEYQAMSREEWINMIEEKAKNEGVALDDSVYELYEKYIDEKQSNDDVVVGQDLEDALYDAIRRAQKFSISGLIAGITAGKYDEDGNLIVKEKHFS